MLYRNIDLFKNIANKLILFTIFLIPTEFFIFNYFNIVHSSYVLVSILVSSSLIAIYFIVNENIIKKYLPDYLKKLSIYISNKTLGIFVLNPLFIFLLKPFYSFIQVENFLIDSIMIFLFSILIFILCILTIEILSKTFLKKVIIIYFFEVKSYHILLIVNINIQLVVGHQEMLSQSPPKLHTSAGFAFINPRSCTIRLQQST